MALHLELFDLFPNTGSSVRMKLQSEISIPYFRVSGPLKAKFCEDATLAATGTA